jgi:hypothetical protein
MKKKGYTAEQIIGKLREGKILLVQGLLPQNNTFENTMDFMFIDVLDLEKFGESNKTTYL